MQVLGFVDADQATQRGEKVNDSRRFLLDPSTSNPVFPVENARDAMPTFEERPLFAAQFTASLLQIAAVIGSVDNDGIVELADFFEFCNEAPDGSICIVDGATVDSFPFFKPPILGNDLVGGRDRVVWFIEPEIEEEGFITISLLIEPGKSLIDHDLTGIALDGSNSLSIAQKIGRVSVA